MAHEKLVKPSIEMSRSSAPCLFGTQILDTGDDSWLNQTY